MKHTNDIQTEDPKTTTRYCPYRGSLDWQIACIGIRCMQYNDATATCKRT